MLSLTRQAFFCIVSLAMYLRFPRAVWQFRRIVGYWPNIAQPRRYHERMLWRKVFDHNPLFTVFCDKLATKDYVASRDPSLATPRTLWSSPDFRAACHLPVDSTMVVKANHGCDFNHMPTDAPGERAHIETLARQWLAVDYSQRDFQPAYGPVRRKLFAEEKLPVDHPLGLIDINVWCCDGQVLMLSAILDNKTPSMRVAYFDADGQPWSDPNAASPQAAVPADMTLPECWRDAVRHAQTLSRGVDFARFDFMSDWHSVWVGEITVYPSAGLGRAGNPAHSGGGQARIAQAWDLRKTWFLTHPQRGWKRLYARWLRQALDDCAPVGLNGHQPSVHPASGKA